MDCGVPMKRRVLRKQAIVDEKKNLLGYVTDEAGNRVVVPILVRTRHFHEQKVSTGSNSFARIFRCKECSSVPVDKDKLTRQIKLAWVEEMTFAGKSLSDKKRHLKANERMAVRGIL